jgi:tetratricopeptide (TPR) repeat protein
MADHGDPGAGALFSSARSLRPDYIPLLLREATWEVDQGRPEAALQLLNESTVATAPVQARLILARASMAGDDLERARSLLEEAIALSPDYGQLHAQLAEVFRRMGRMQDAETAALRGETLRGGPTLEDPVLATLYGEGVSSRWHILRGQSYQAAGQAEAARESFQSAVDARPDDAHGWNQLGVALQALGRFEEASEAHRRALAIRPGFADAGVNLGSSLFLGGDRRAGLEAAVLAVEMDSTHPQAYLNVGMFQHAMGRSDQASAAYLAGLARAPFDPRIAIRLSWLLATDRAGGLRDGRRSVVLAEAVNEMEAYQSAASLDVLAAAYAEYGAFDRAIATARQAVLIASEDGDEDMAGAVASRMDLYLAGRPYRE